MVKVLFVLLFGFTFQFLSAQQPIFATGASGELYSIDLVSCSINYKGSGSQYGDIAFTTDGHLWGIASGNLYQIDTSNASFILIGNIGLPCVSLVGLNDSTLLIESGMSLYAVKTSDASNYFIGNIGYQASGDLTWYDKDLYMTASGLLIKIVLDSTHTSILSATPVNNLGNPIPTCEGSVTASFTGLYNSIVGFNGPNAYKICQIDGSYEMLCSSLVTNGTSGGASIPLYIQQPEPTTCQRPNSVITLNLEKPYFEILPNPVSKSGYVHIRLNRIISSPFTVRIITLQGTTLLSKAEQVSTSDLKIDLNNVIMTSGVFLIEVKTSSEEFRSLLIVQ